MNRAIGGVRAGRGGRRGSEVPGEDLKSDPRLQVEALERVNADLATEIRALSAGRTERSRSGVMPAARRLARLVEERNSLAAELQVAQERLVALEQSDKALGAQVREQHLYIEQLTAEVTSLRSGIGGILRRLKARVLRRQRG